AVEDPVAGDRGQGTGVSRQPECGPLSSSCLLSPVSCPLRGREPAMPLIDCGACGRQISTEAVACPQCGHPNRPSPPTPGYKLSWQQLCSTADAAEADVERTFALELHAGDWISLEAPDGIGLWTTVEAGGLYTLVQTDVRTKDRLWAQAKLTKGE